MESTNSKFFTYLVGFSGLLISSVAAWFSVTGIAQLFSGSFWSVVIMAGSLEFGKLVAASFIYRYWALVNWLQKAYMTAAVIILIGITSMGIFGFLSNSYMGATQEFDTMITKLEVYKDQLQILEEDKELIKKSKVVADKIFRLAMKDAEPKVAGWKIWSAWKAVDLFGRWSIIHNESNI